MKRHFLFFFLLNAATGITQDQYIDIQFRGYRTGDWEFTTYDPMTSLEK